MLYARQTQNLLAAGHRRLAGRGRGGCLAGRTAEDRAGRACPRRPSRRARTGWSGRSSTRASSGRKTAWSSTWPRPTCPRTPPRSICPSPWASWPAADRSPPSGSAEYAVVGELALDGTTRPTSGALSMAMAAAEQQGLRGLLVPSRQRGRGGRGRGRRDHPRRQPGPGRGLSHRRNRDRAAALAARRAVPHASRPTRSISPTSAARRWPSGR